MKVALVTADFPPREGGLSRLASEVAFNLYQQESLAGVLVPKVKGTRLPPSFPFPVDYCSSPFRKGSWSLLPAYLTSSHFRHQTLQRADYLLALHPFFGGAYAWMNTIKGMTIPYGVFAYGSEFLNHLYPRSDRTRGFLLRIYKRARQVIALSRFTRDQLIEFGVPISSVEYFQPAVDTNLFSPDPVTGLAREKLIQQGLKSSMREQVILTTGSLIKRKGHRFMLIALEQLVQTFPGLVYWIIGSGPEKALLKKMTFNMKLKSHVHFLGDIPDRELPDYYRACDLYVLPATQIDGEVEGVGLSLLEASACGKPVITTRSGGLPEGVLEGITGIVIPPEDPIRLAESIAYLLKNPSQREAMGQAGRDFCVRNRGWNQRISGLMEILTIGITNRGTTSGSSRA